jgi:hypothetical protein
MTVWYSPRDERILEEVRKDRQVEQATGRKPESPEERERIWKLLTDAARS